MIRSDEAGKADSASPPVMASSHLDSPVVRLKSQDLFCKTREVEIDHEGRIYRLRLTQFNKLILTA